MRSSTKRRRLFTNQVIFYMEQWIALLTGIACLAVFLWAILQGHAAFSLRSLSQLGKNALVAVGWSLTIAVGLLGVTLMRFAFSKRSQPALLTASSADKTSNAHAPQTANGLKLDAATRRHPTHGEIVVPSGAHTHLLPQTNLFIPGTGRHHVEAALNPLCPRA